jgi:hypothetical protein
VIGVYEPMVVVLDGEALLTSAAAAGSVAARAHRFHEACFALDEAGEQPERG